MTHQSKYQAKKNTSWVRSQNLMFFLLIFSKLMRAKLFKLFNIQYSMSKSKFILNLWHVRLMKKIDNVIKVLAFRMSSSFLAFGLIFPIMSHTCSCSFYFSMAFRFGSMYWNINNILYNASKGCTDSILPNTDSFKCYFVNSCTNISCCLELAEIGKSFYMNIDIRPCDFELSTSIEGLRRTESLINYEWGTPQGISLFGLITIEWVQPYIVTCDDKNSLNDESNKNITR